MASRVHIDISSGFTVVQGFQRNLFDVLLPCLNGCSPVLVRGTTADWWALSAAASLRPIWLISFDRSLQDLNLLSRLFVCLRANASPCLCSPTVSPSIRSGSARHWRCLSNDGGLFISFFLARTELGEKNEVMSLDSFRPCSLWIHTNSPAELERGGNLHLSKRSLLFPLELLWDGLMT